MAKPLPIRCIIVDDEPLAIQILSDYVSKTPALQLEATCGNALEALSTLKSKQIDLMFLDIQMPDLTGLEMLDLLPQKPFIIFTTAFSEYALDGFNQDAVDYLLKPISLGRFLKAVDKVIERTAQPAFPIVQASDNTQQHIFIKTEYKIVPVNLSTILRVEGLKDYIKIYTTEAMLLTLMGMKDIAKQLPNNQFIRIHKSHIISLNYIDSIERGRVFIQGEPIAIGATYKQAFFEKIGM